MASPSPFEPNRQRASAETAREARQGPLGRPILYVLVGGLILAAVFVTAMIIWSGGEDLPPPGQVEETPAIRPSP